MKYTLFILSAFLFIACNSNKKETSTTENKAQVDTTITDDIISPPDPAIGMTGDTLAVVPTNRLIVPGASIGLTSIGQKNEDASKHLGPPAMEDAGMGKEMATWYSIHGKDTSSEMNIFFVTNMGDENEASRVKYIRITSSFFSTSQHIRTGSSMDSVKKYFPGIKTIAAYTSLKTKKPVTIYEDERSGISFEIDDQLKCVGITVQKPGEFANEIYISLFPDIVFPRGDH